MDTFFKTRSSRAIFNLPHGLFSLLRPLDMSCCYPDNFLSNLSLVNKSKHLLKRIPSHFLSNHQLHNKAWSLLFKETHSLQEVLVMFFIPNLNSIFSCKFITALKVTFTIPKVKPIFSYSITPSQNTVYASFQYKYTLSWIVFSVIYFLRNPFFHDNLKRFISNFSFLIMNFILSPKINFSKNHGKQLP